jgi:hypothetical protein
MNFGGKAIINLSLSIKPSARIRMFEIKVCDCVSPSFCGGTILKMRSLLVVIEQFSDDHTADIGHYGQTAICQLFSTLHFIIFD